MNIFIILGFLVLLSAPSEASEDFKPFLTDYCTSYPEGTRAKPDLWKHCCEEHDLFFWGGGSLEDRKATDLRLKSCVEATGERVQARLIYAAVSLGGRSPIRFKTKQWGNAFEESRPRYQALSEQETTDLVHYLETHNPELSEKLKQKFKDQLNSRLDVQ